MNRKKLSDAINISGSKLENGVFIRLPNFVHATPEFISRWIAGEEIVNLKFPVICKPLQACGHRDSHQMIILPSFDSLKELLENDSEWIIQEYVNHDGVIYKAYVMGDFYQVFPRESLPNFPVLYKLSSAIHFNSHDPISSSMFAQPQTKEEAFAEIPRTRYSPVSYRKSIDVGKLNVLVGSISKQLQRTLGLEMFGFDLIRESSSGLYYIVDVNYFPSYKGFASLSELLVRHLLKKLCGSCFLYKVKGTTK
jgi:inositol-1,3,4-trisphosphate 5/6-kinase/inositol-tetrakisphosphate 1-kinase